MLTVYLYEFLATNNVEFHALVTHEFSHCFASRSIDHCVLSFCGLKLYGKLYTKSGCVIIHYVKQH